jgi:hypothetical protein
MKHLERCSYTILESPLENKWGTTVKAWVNKVLFMKKRMFRLTLEIGGGTRSKGRRCNWCKATMMYFKKIVGVMG